MAHEAFSQCHQHTIFKLLSSPYIHRHGWKFGPVCSLEVKVVANKSPGKVEGGQHFTNVCLIWFVIKRRFSPRGEVNGNEQSMLSSRSEYESVGQSFRCRGAPTSTPIVIPAGGIRLCGEENGLNFPGSAPRVRVRHGRQKTPWAVLPVGGFVLPKIKRPSQKNDVFRATVPSCDSMLLCLHSTQSDLISC